MEPLEDLYFQWLCDKVMRAPVPTPSLTYWNLLRDLHGQPYVWVQGYDENRAEDGVELRTYFLSESPINSVSSSWLHMPCSVLEFMIAFSARAEFNALLEEPSDWWFWHMVDNLGINFPDSVEIPRDYLADVLETWMFRAYAPDGTGGLFPREQPEQDQREVETWYQFMGYLEEKGW